MSAKIIPINRHLEDAWADYIARKSAAETSGMLADGVEAGRAWRRWIELFLTDDQRKALGGGR